MRAVVAIHGYRGSEDYGQRHLDALGLPLWDIFTARSSCRELAYLISGDSGEVLGPLGSRP